MPYQPPSHLTVSTAPVKAGDFAMLAGYPGTTYRHRTASEFAEQIEWQLPSRVSLFDGILKTIDSATTGDADAEVLYASTVASLKNGLKRAQGELEGLRRSDAVHVRRADEQAMLAWLGKQTDSARRRVPASMRCRQCWTMPAPPVMRDQLLATIRGRTELLRAAITLQRLAAERVRPDVERENGYQQRDETRIEAEPETGAAPLCAEGRESDPG